MSLAEAFPNLYLWIRMVLFIWWLGTLCFCTGRLFWHFMFNKVRNHEIDCMYGFIILPILILAWTLTVGAISSK